MNTNQIDIPKNIRQIGHTLSKDKIYIEDYVMTYIKQLYSEPFDREKLLLLIGRRLNDGEMKYLFIKGVIEVNKRIRECNEILENDNMQEVIKIREDYYDDEDIVGLGIISKNEWFGFDSGIREYFCNSYVGDTIIVYDINEEERVYTYSNIGFVKEKGYYIYYDRNESMQNYMLCMKDGKSIEYGYATTEEVDNTIDEKIRSFTIPKNPVYTSRKMEFNKYKKHFDDDLKKKLKYCSVVMGIVVLLYVCVNKVDQIEQRTKRKAKDLYNVTKEVISQNNDVIEMETTVEDIKGNDNNNDSSKNKVSEENDGGIADFHNKKEENDKELYKETKLDEEDKKKNTDLSNNTNYYIVKKGDALVDISRRIYGTVKKVDAIKRVNDLKDEDKIYIGQRLVMP